MSTFFWMTISCLARALLSLRYRVKITGLEKLNKKNLHKKQGILFLPNHPAHMDPLMIFLFFWPKYRMRPLVIEYVYRLPFLKPILRLVKALSIPNFDTAVNQIKITKAQASFEEIAKGLKKKENFVFYPAGKLKSSGKEILGGSSGAHSLLQECPEANIVLIRTTGLWGSSFSRAQIGRSPPLPQTLLHGLKTLLKNFVFFSPRRKVLIEIEVNPAGFPLTSSGTNSRVDFNRYLENWYNRYRDEKGDIHESEPLKLVSYSAWKREVPKIVKPKTRHSEGGGLSIPDTVRDKIYNEIRKILNQPSLVIKPEMSLPFDLGMDSLNLAELIAYLMKNHDVKEVHPEHMETVQHALEMAVGERVEEKDGDGKPSVSWPKEFCRLAPQLPLGNTIPEAFLHTCQRFGDSAACGDDLLGVLNYKKMKRSVLVLAQYFKQFPEKHVAVLLPASAGAFIVILALLFAKKVPVMLNWTLGPRYLDEMMHLSGSKRVISSWRFLDRLPHVDFGKLSDALVLLEDVRPNISLAMKLKGAFLSLLPVSSVLSALNLKGGGDKPAVILFTSGTEANPKGVPLSHQNILSNLRASMQCVVFKSSDVIYGILPPFHSFGFSVAGLFAFVSGTRIAFYPDPTDGFALAEGIHRWKVTVFCSAPSFLKGLFYAAEPEQLMSIRYFVCGAEKAPPELFEKVENLGSHGKLIEGYGITECSPIITISRPNLPPKGVGRILPNLQLRTIHPETLEPLPEGSEGEICVRGPSVFHGYLGNPRTPFIDLDGQKWYRTGDLGHLESDGSLILSGRLKRFTKLGGEMISLGAVEQALVSHFLQAKKMTADLPSIAICADERSGKPLLIVFTTLDIEKEEANRILEQAGFSRLIKISKVEKIDAIPLLGVGKTDYRKLQGMIV